jgi:hypothetical protein
VFYVATDDDVQERAQPNYIRTAQQLKWGLASVIVRSCGANKGLPNSPEDFRDDEIIRIVYFKRPMI